MKAVGARSVTDRSLFPQGARVGLLGGSFDPPHCGHLHLSREALKRFGLDRVVWLVSPGNPLKPNPPAPMAQRLEACRALIDHPRILVSDVEARLGTRYTAQTLSALTHQHPETAFCWLMGADNLAQFHRWEDWRHIMAMVPVGVLARPETRGAALASKAARVYARCRLPERDSRSLGRSVPPKWCFANMPMRRISSSALRAAGAAGPGAAET